MRYTPLTARVETATHFAEWTTGLCQCLHNDDFLYGNRSCCGMCFLSVCGCDYCLWKDMDEQYQQRKNFEPHTYVYQPPGHSTEECCGPYIYRAAQCLPACLLSYATCDLLKCFCLARQRANVRGLYGLPGSYCLDCMIVGCCRPCAFSQLQQQLEASRPHLPERAPAQGNTMRVPAKGPDFILPYGVVGKSDPRHAGPHEYI